MSSIKPRQLVPLPWRWQGPSLVRDEHDNVWWELRIADLQDFFVAAESREAVLADAPDALETFLAAYEDSPEWPLLPEGLARGGLREVRPPEVRDQPAPAATSDRLELIPAGA